MARIRRLAAAAGALTLASVLVAGPASADTAETYIGSASGKALDLKLLGQGVTLGVSTSKITSALTAVAEGAGQLGIGGTTQKAEVSGSGSSIKPDACVISLPVLNILNAGLACGSASSSITAGNPVATAKGSVAGIDLDLESALGLVNVTGLVSGTLGTVQSTVCGLPAVGSILCPVVNTATGTVDNLLKTKTLDVILGDSTSTVTTAAGKVTSVAEAKGGEIRVLPLRLVPGVLNPGPLATITLSAAKATAVYDRASGSSTPTIVPALVTIKLGVTDLLPATEITVPVGTSQTILAGTPLESDIIVAAGRTVKNADGTIGAIADGVTLNLLKGLNGGIQLSLAHAEAGVGGTLAQITPLIPNLELPRTGGTPWIPMAGVGVLGLAVLVRRLLVRAH